MAGDDKSSGPMISIEQLEERVNTIGRAVFGSDRFGQIMNATVTTQTRLKKGFNDQMARGLNFYNLPSQDDVVGIAAQCARIEERLVRIESMLTKLAGSAGVKPVAASSGPPRTRKPKSAASKSKTTRTKKKTG